MVSFVVNDRRLRLPLNVTNLDARERDTWILRYRPGSFRFKSLAKDIRYILSFYYQSIQLTNSPQPQLTPASMWLNLSAIFRQLSHDPSVRAVVLTGAGDRAFTAGLDVTAASESGPLSSSDVAHQDTARKANAVRRHILEFQSCITDVEKCEKPVIAVLHGISFGLALDMCLACDIRISTTTTKFSVKEVDIGVGIFHVLHRRAEAVVVKLVKQLGHGGTLHLMLVERLDGGETGGGAGPCTGWGAGRGAGHWPRM